MLALEKESWAWYSVSWLLVLARMVSRAVLLGSVRRYQIEDYLMLAAMGTYTTSVVFLIIAEKMDHLYPDDIADHMELTPEIIEAQVYEAKAIFIVEQMQCATIWIIKACMLFMYSRLTYVKPASTVNANALFITHMINTISRVSTRHEIAVKIVAGYTAGSFIVMEILFLGVWCQPITQYWNIDPDNVQCSTYEKHMIMNLIFNISSDVMIIIIPIHLFFSSSLELKKKLILCGVFAIGIFTIISAILSKYYSFSNLLGNGWTFWYIRESSTAIIAANLPATWPLLRKLCGLRPFKENSKTKGKSYSYSSQHANSTF